MYVADADEGIGLTIMTDHTIMQFGDVIWYNLLWIESHQSMMNAILEVSIIFFYRSFLVSKLFGHNGHKLTCDYFSSESSDLLVRTILVVYTQTLQEMEYFSYSVLLFHNIYGSLISLEVVAIFKANFIYPYTPPGGICLHSCTTNHFSTRSPNNLPSRAPRRFISLHFLLDMGTWWTQVFLAWQLFN